MRIPPSNSLITNTLLSLASFVVVVVDASIFVGVGAGIEAGIGDGATNGGDIGDAGAEDEVAREIGRLDTS
jgi:hypothetical protein